MLCGTMRIAKPLKSAKDYWHDPDENRSCEYNPYVMASPGHLGFLFRPFIKASFQQAQNKNPSACGTGIVFDVGHTGFEPVTSTLSR